MNNRLSTKQFEPDFPVETVREGRVTVLVPKLSAYTTEPSEYAPSKAPVFYNPIMELNRDISVLAIQAYQRLMNREISVCEPLTSSGVRGVRFAVEVQGAARVFLNDISTRAIEVAKHNIKLNGLNGRVKVTRKDANCLLSCKGKPLQRFDVVDLDPFGSPAPYIDSAVRALRNKGLLALTATDLACLCGVHPRACLRKYGGKPLRTEYCHELAVRLLAGSVAASAAKHDIGVWIRFCHSTAHYIRIYAQVEYGAKKADESLRNNGYLLHCFNCLHREMVRSLLNQSIICPECGSSMEFAGPLWKGSIFDSEFCDAMIQESEHRAFKNSETIAKLLSLTADETKAHSTYYVLDKLSAKLGVAAPPVAGILACLKDKGYDAFLTHFSSRGIKTNAPARVLQETLKSC